MSNKNNTHPQQILLAIDGSDHSRAAAMFLGDLHWGEKISVTALAVLDKPHTPRQHMLLAALDATIALLQDKGIEVNTGLLHGHPAEALIHYADEHSPDLIVVGAKGLRATLGILLGGIAQQVVEYAQWPVLVVRSPYNRLRRIMLVTDGSEYSQSAVEYLTRFPVPPKVKVYVSYVMPPAILSSPEIIARTWPIGPEAIQPLPVELPGDEEARQAEEETIGRRILEMTMDKLTPTGLKASSQLLRGDAATEILAFSQEKQVDLIVAGSRGLSQVRGWLLGSVSRKLVHYAGCSVLIVKERSRQ